jgi:UDPglucose 6-dehydrogenase
MKISIIGLGKLGSCYAAVLSYKGYDVTGVDIDQASVDSLNKYIAPVVEPDLQDLISKRKGRLNAITDTAKAIEQSNVSFVIVPTPSDSEGRFSMKYVLSAAESIGRGLNNRSKYHVVVMTSTIMPGDMEGKFIPALEKFSGKKAGKDFGVCYNPQFIALGSVIKNMLHPDTVLIGESDLKAGNLIQWIYMNTVENKPHFARMNFVNAEIAKISINAFITLKVSFANMIGQVCNNTKNGNATDVLNAVGSDTRIGNKYLSAGLPFGGPCFPRDNTALSVFAENIGVNPFLPKATVNTNFNHMEFIVESIIENIPPLTKTITILGLAYKANTPVIEESPSIFLAKKLINKGIKVCAYDPLAMDNAKREIGSINYMSSTESAINGADVIVIATACDDFKKITPNRIKKTAKLIDCCGLLDEEQWGSRLIKLGKYTGKDRPTFGIENHSTINKSWYNVISTIIPLSQMQRMPEYKKYGIIFGNVDIISKIFSYIFEDNKLPEIIFKSLPTLIARYMDSDRKYISRIEQQDIILSTR